MASHSLFGGELRPDQERYARLAGGMTSPLWIPFMAAASMGAAWWMMQNWPRLASGARGAEGGSAETQTPTPASALAGEARSFSQEVAAPVTESLAVQGANDSEPAARTQAPSAPKPAAQAAPAAAPQPTARTEAPPAPRKEKAPSKAAAPKEDPAVSRLLAAAAAAEHPEPELPPHEGLPARKKGGNKSKKNGA